MRIINLETIKIIATLRPCKAKVFLCFDEIKEFPCKVQKASNWEFKTMRHAPIQISQEIELADGKMTKDAMRAIITHFAKKLNLKEVLISAEDRVEQHGLFDSNLSYTFKIESNEINQKGA